MMNINANFFIDTIRYGKFLGAKEFEKQLQEYGYVDINVFDALISEINSSPSTKELIENACKNFCPTFTNLYDFLNDIIHKPKTIFKNTDEVKTIISIAFKDIEKLAWEIFEEQFIEKNKKWFSIDDCKSRVKMLYEFESVEMKKDGSMIAKFYNNEHEGFVYITII